MTTSNEHYSLVDKYMCVYIINTCTVLHVAMMNEQHTLLKNHISPLAVGLGTPWPLKWNNTLSVFKEKLQQV